MSLLGIDTVKDYLTKAVSACIIFISVFYGLENCSENDNRVDNPTTVKEKVGYKVREVATTFSPVSSPPLHWWPVNEKMLH